jgi:hypothetical protein
MVSHFALTVEGTTIGGRSTRVMGGDIPLALGDRVPTTPLQVLRGRTGGPPGGAVSWADGRRSGARL